MWIHNPLESPINQGHSNSSPAIHEKPHVQRQLATRIGLSQGLRFPGKAREDLADGKTRMGSSGI